MNKESKSQRKTSTRKGNQIACIPNKEEREPATKHGNKTKAWNKPKNRKSPTGQMNNT